MAEKVLLDTDMGNDCDDAGALALLCGYAQRGACKILGVAGSTSKPFAPSCIKAIADDYGLSFPIGALKDGFDAAVDHYCGLFQSVEAAAEEYVGFYRRILSKNSGVTLISIGALHGLDLLLRSPPDSFSPLSGTELFARAVSRVYAMCGRFDGEAEWNVAMDIPAARSFFSRCPSPVTVCPFEAGFGVLTGRYLRPGGAAARIYEVFCKEKDGVRDSWDPLTVYAAVDGEKCTVEPADLFLGTDGIMKREKGNSYGVIKAAKEIEKTLDGRMV